VEGAFPPFQERRPPDDGGSQTDAASADHRSRLACCRGGAPFLMRASDASSLGGVMNRLTSPTTRARGIFFGFRILKSRWYGRRGEEKLTIVSVAWGEARACGVQSRLIGADPDLVRQGAATPREIRSRRTCSRFIFAASTRSA